MSEVLVERIENIVAHNLFKKLNIGIDFMVLRSCFVVVVLIGTVTTIWRPIAMATTLPAILIGTLGSAPCSNMFRDYVFYGIHTVSIRY